MRLRVGAATDIGRARRRNEDSYLVKDPLFVVADGMGGHRGGDVASKMAIDLIEPAAAEVAADGLAPLIERMQRANREVMERGEADRDLRGMGTTVTAIVADGGRAHVAHIGDSRAYLLRDGALQQLTEDHTLVQKMVREGRLTEDEAAHHPQRSILLRVLGVEDDMPVDQLTLDLHPGDRLLLCTDGLSNMLSRADIQEILAGETDPQAAAERLIEAANREGGDDNITVIVLDVAGDGGHATDPDGEARRSVPERVARGAGSGEPESGRDISGIWERPDLGPGSRATATLARPRQEAAPRRERTQPRPFPWRRVAVWGGAVLTLTIAAGLGTRLYVDRQWYVGDSQGRVAIYNGIPATVLGFDLHHVVETSQVSSADAERLRVYQDLRSGITASSFADAQSIVRQICLDVAAATETGGPGAPGPSCPTRPAGAGG